MLDAGWVARSRERRPRYVVFGEIHGTREAPAFVGNVACALTVRGERILLAIEQNSTDYDHILVLAGDFHARKTAVGSGADRFEPMAMRLARLGPTLSLDMRFAGGSMWNCIVKPDVKLRMGQSPLMDAIACGNHPTSGESDLKRPPFIRLGSFSAGKRAHDYDGFSGWARQRFPAPAG